MLVCEHAEYQSSGTNATEWSEAIIDWRNSICAFAALTSQNVCQEKGSIWETTHPTVT